MANYFSYLPEVDYVSRLPDAKIGDYIEVKNLFKKGKIRPDIFQDLSFFTKYKIQGDDRPDNVAYKVYNDASLDWVILLCNNVINVQTEWPMEQNNFDAYVLDKYGDYETLYSGIHHYETVEVKNTQGLLVVPAGLRVAEDYSVSYYDFLTDAQVDRRNITVPITNYEYEESLENNKRNIFILKQEYLGIILNDMEEIMAYKEGSTQYVSETLKRADNIRLYE
jgi:Base plate wedge protein 53